MGISWMSALSTSTIFGRRWTLRLVDVDVTSMNAEARRCGRDVGGRFLRLHYFTFIGLGKVRVRLAGFAHLAAGPVVRTGCYLSPENRDR